MYIIHGVLSYELLSYELLSYELLSYELLYEYTLVYHDETPVYIHIMIRMIIIHMIIIRALATKLVVFTFCSCISCYFVTK